MQTDFLNAYLFKHKGEQMKFRDVNDFERSMKYFDAFWAHEMIDRPLVMVQAPKDNVEYVPVPPYLSGTHDGNLEGILKQMDANCASTYYAGEAFPQLDLSFGADQFSGFLGAELYLAETKKISWSKPFVEDWKVADLSLKENEGSLYDRFKKMMKRASEFSEGKFLIEMPDLHSNFDAICTVKKTEDVFFDLYDCPEEIEKALLKISEAFKKVMKDVSEIYDTKRRGSCSQINLFSKGTFQTVASDYIYNLGPEHVERFILPMLEKEISVLDHSVYHCDGKGQLIHLPKICALKGLDAIQWQPGAGNPKTYCWPEVLKEIQSRGKLLWLGDWDFDAVKAHYKELNPVGLAFSLKAKSQKEADEIIKWFKKNT